MKVAVIGASGFIGNRLVEELIKLPDFSVKAISLHPEKLTVKNSYKIEPVKCDVFDNEKLCEVLRDCEVVYYLVHMMSEDCRNFPFLEDKAALSFCEAARKAKVKKVIYLGGLGSESDDLSRHLKSRHKTGTILGKNLPAVYEFRASVIIGDGSAPFEIIKSIVHKTPLMVLPRWADVLTQPICAGDAIKYLVQVADLKIKGHIVFEIGGPEKMPYKELLLRYAKFKSRNLKIITIRSLPCWPAKYWLGLFVGSKYKKVAKSMVKSLENEVIVKDSKAKRIFKNIVPEPIEKEFS
jgi:uncharacterized protein YbjT (DUF2867 family)